VDFGRAAYTLSKLSYKVVEAMIEGAAGGVIRAMGAERLGVMIENNYHTVESLFYAMQSRPNYDPKLTPEEVERLEAIRKRLPNAVLPILGATRKIVSQFPPEAVESKVTADWLMQRAEKSQPEIAKVIKSYRRKGRQWLEAEAKQIRDYLLGRLVWDPESRKLVEKHG